MLTYLIILLDDTATSYCHYTVTKKGYRLISLDDLQAGIVFSMKENLNVQFVYPDYELPQEYKDIIETVDHVNIKPVCQNDDVDVMVLNGWDDATANLLGSKNCIIRTSRQELAQNKDLLKYMLRKVSRLNIVLTDIDDFNDSDIEDYQCLLEDLALYPFMRRGSNRN